MSFREVGETAVIYLTGAGSEPFQRRDKSLKFGGQISLLNTPDGIRTIGGKRLTFGESDRPHVNLDIIPCANSYIETDAIPRILPHGRR